MKSGAFSLEEDEMIIASVQEGKSGREIARALGRLAWSVARRRERLWAAGRLGKMKRGPKPGYLEDGSRSGMIISPWLYIADGVLMRTVRAA